MQFGDQRVAQDRTLQQSRCIGLRDLAVPGSVGLDGDHRTMPTLGEAARFEGSNPNAIEWRSAKLPCYGKKRLFRVKHGKS